MTAAEFLDELDAARAKATPEPWVQVGAGPSSYVLGEISDDGESYVDVADCELFADAALIVAAVNALPKLTAAVRAVEALAEELLQETTESARLARAYQQAESWAGAASAEAKAWTSGNAAARLRAVLADALAGDS